jgi:hypothetical protein
MLSSALNGIASLGARLWHALEGEAPRRPNILEYHVGPGLPRACFVEFLRAARESETTKVRPAIPPAGEDVAARQLGIA